MSLGLVPGEDIDGFWRRVAAICGDWLAAQGAPLRDAVLLLPFAQQLAPARRAFLARGGWLPVLATTHSLASALGPAPLAAPGQLSGDAPVDALAADDLLAQQSWAQALKRDDPRAYRLALARLVETAHAFARVTGQRDPASRAAWFEAARRHLGDDPVGGVERALALVALVWAASDERAPATDALFRHRPSAWIVLQAGGPDPLAEALLARSEVPALHLVADLDLDGLAEPPARVEEALCADFETLAQASAVAVLQHLAAGRAPVALIAQDRVVVRRVRALLTRQGVPLHDETGWTLATTPAASALMALLRAALGGGAVDDWLAWLKLSAEPSAALDALEAFCRRRHIRRAEALDAFDAPPAKGLWQSRRQALAPLSSGGRRTLAQWLFELKRALGPEPLAGLEGGEGVLTALWLSRNPWPGSAHEGVLAGARLDGSGFLAWVGEVLENGQFVPDNAGQAPVVITPLVRAMLRPFGALVLPGADAETLGRAGRPLSLISDADAAALGLPTQAAQREAEAQAFAQALRAPVLTLLRCTRAGAEPLPASPLIDRLAAAARRDGRASPLQPWRDERLPQGVPPRPALRASTGAVPLPATLSASAVEALRRCPYQFFSRHVLGLQEADELEAEPAKRDYGTWLHAVLHRFHTARQPGDAAAQLRAAAAAESIGLDDADFLPWRASFERLLPRYVDWLREAEGRGQQFSQGELDRECRPFEGAVAGLVLRGRIDRIDTTPAGQRLLLDYKTGSASGLKDRVAEPLEDTQMAVYALLMEAAPDLAAAYLALDDPGGVVAIEHPDVSATAQRLREGLQSDLSLVQHGAPLPALGEGSACEHCEARGLCRRDDWA
ncbi:PD-(D/E)XK nuclease family protein [Pelomonas sp. P7]|uniref:PD-(D/E)XK nuclease family protein n=1 Tax=Pelomonas caseinilytica TaxID=2906763 RepID=A0ABS8XCU8_9BURK|nr:PD-(D/E)XK nuclease family protein [Pelomonas sp. P7]MCE4536763.1 PD-(D/E)XK nuclease family protein [Pelomonas sp. P7]